MEKVSTFSLDSLESHPAVRREGFIDMQTYTFGDYRLDEAEHRLTRGGILAREQAWPIWRSAVRGLLAAEGA